jgi:cell division protein FtsN
MTKDYAKRGSKEKASKSTRNKKSQRQTKPRKKSSATKSSRKRVPRRAIVLYLILIPIFIFILYFIIHKSKQGPEVITATPVNLAAAKKPSSSNASFVFKPVSEKLFTQHNDYVLQLGTFKEHDHRLHALQKRLLEYHFKAHLVKVYLHGTNSFRLQMGSYKSEKQAKTVQQQLAMAKVAGLIVAS